MMLEMERLIGQIKSRVKRKPRSKRNLQTKITWHAVFPDGYVLRSIKDYKTVMTHAWRVSMQRTDGSVAEVGGFSASLRRALEHTRMCVGQASEAAAGPVFRSRGGGAGRQMKHKKRVNIFDACERAGQMLLNAGFEFRYQSQKTETKYYGLPGRPHNIRVSAHKSKKGPIGLAETVARITFNAGGCETPQCIAISDESFEHMVAVAIGFYVMKSNREMQSSWRGKRGTWEAAHGQVIINTI